MCSKEGWSSIWTTSSRPCRIGMLGTPRCIPCYLAEDSGIEWSERIVSHSSPSLHGEYGGQRRGNTKRGLSAP